MNLSKPLHSRRFILAVGLVSVTAFLLTLPSATNFLKGSLIDDAVFSVCNTDGDSSFSVPEMRRCIGATIRAIREKDVRYDFNTNGTLEREDLRVLIRSIRDYLSASCGNSETEAGEQCDDGNESNSDACVHECRNAACGDEYVQENIEECDDGNNSNADSCTNRCRNAVCGDGFVQNDEQCDDGNRIDANDGCSNLCRTTSGSSCAAGSSCVPFFDCIPAKVIGSCGTAQVCCKGNPQNSQSSKKSAVTSSVRSSRSAAESLGCPQGSSCVSFFECTPQNALGECEAGAAKVCCKGAIQNSQSSRKSSAQSSTRSSQSGTTGTDCQAGSTCVPFFQCTPQRALGNCGNSGGICCKNI